MTAVWIGVGGIAFIGLVALWGVVSPQAGTRAPAAGRHAAASAGAKARERLGDEGA